MVGQAGLHQQQPRGAARRRAPRDEQPEGLLGGVGPRREQLLVELEERDQPDGAPRPVQHRLGADEHVARRRPASSREASVVASTAATSVRGSSAARSSRTWVMPGRTARKRLPWQCRHTSGRTVPQRTQASTVAPEASSRCSTVAPQRSQRASSRQLRQASRRARPRRLSTHTARLPGADGAAQRVGQRTLGEQPLARLLVTLVDDRRRAASDRDAGSVLGGPTATSASTVGAGVTTRTAAPARRARSSATVRPFQVGARSSSNASSPSSSTTTAARSGTGAHTAVRPPITTHAPARARCQCSVRSRVGMVGTEGDHLAALVAQRGRGARGACGRRVDHQGRAFGATRWRAQVVARGDHVQLGAGQRRARVHRGLRLGFGPRADDVGG